MTGAQAAALAPVRSAMLALARCQARAVIEAARAEADGITRDAELAAAQAVEAGRSAGEAQGVLLAAAERSNGRARSQAILLGARGAALERLRAQILAAAAGLRGEPGYPELVDRLSALAVAAAGPSAAVEAAPEGGVVARTTGVAVNCSLLRLADRAIEALGGRVRELWMP